MRKKETFVVQIIGWENSTWQGQITWLDENETKKFRSMLEMIKLLNQAMELEESENM